jgi:hypothetical protein
VEFQRRLQTNTTNAARFETSSIVVRFGKIVDAGTRRANPCQRWKFYTFEPSTGTTTIEAQLTILVEREFVPFRVDDEATQDAGRDERSKICDILMIHTITRDGKY